MNEKLPPTKINKLEIELGLKEKSPIELFYEKPCELTLRKVSKRIQTPEMVKLAIENDGTAIKNVSKKLITEDLCKIAVNQNGLALRYIPEAFCTKEIVELAVTQNGMAISYVSENDITKELAKIAVSYPVKYEGNYYSLFSFSDYDYYRYPISFIPQSLIDEQLVIDSIKNSPCSLKVIPTEYINEDLILLAVNNDGNALQYVTSKFMNKEVIAAAIASEPLSLWAVPQNRKTKKLCNAAFNANPFVFKYIPERYITIDMCLTIIKECDIEDREKRLKIEWIPEKLRNDKAIIDSLVKKLGANYIIEWNEKIIQKIEEGSADITTKPLSKDIVDYLRAIINEKNSRPIPKLAILSVDTPNAPSNAILVKKSNSKQNTYDLTLSGDSPTKTVYYISDIHLEHQLKKLLEKENVSFSELSEKLDKKIYEMLASVNRCSGYLLIGGDVGHHKGLVTLFYRKLQLLWHGTIISVLGNHELWDDNTDFLANNSKSRTIKEIINDYSERINLSRWSDIKMVLLQNELFIRYKNRQHCVISEEQILAASNEDLRDILLKADFVLLGGIGFSGLNQHYNAEIGLYRSTITTLEKDKELTEKFNRVYEKVYQCAKEMQVIVLTHTPVYDWTDKPCNPNWVYINGHTHHNSLIREKDGTTVLSDNQVGYKPSKWKLNAFTISGWYDPFKEMEDGVHQITSEMYKDFNLARGIQSNGCNYPGNIYVLKRNDMYMFLIQSASSLCLLAGGQRKRLNNSDIYYYYNNMEKYAKRVHDAVLPYQNALRAIAREIRSIGGWGRIHGCIIDIDFFNHIYLNPFDGKITPYYAWDTSSRIVYDDLPSLLKAQVPQLKGIFEKVNKSGGTPLLSQYAVSEKKQSENTSLATVPKLVLGTDIYEPSRIIKSIQYIFDNNIIRIWNDEILTADFTNQLSVLAIEKNEDE